MNIRIAVVALAFAGVAGAGAFTAYRLGVTEGTKQAPTGPAATAAANVALKAGDVDPANGRRILYWSDPMAPGQKFDRPGKSPFMDMQLVPVYADAQDSGGVVISPRVQQNLGLRTAEVRRGTLAQRLEAVGSVTYNDRDVALVQARSNGFLERLYVRAPLDPVRRGQPLAEVYVPEWVAAQEEYLSARRIASADAKTFGALVDAARQRMRLAGMNEEQIRRVETSGSVQARATLVAPIGGVVTELAAREGMTVMAGAPLFRINGVGTVWVNAEVPETLAAHVHPGSAVEATAAALPEKVFKGKVSTILPEVNPATRTMKARVELANPGAQLVPGMFARVNFAPAQAKDSLLVPTEAVIQTGRRAVVIVAEGEGRFTSVDVDIGMESNGETEIRRGLRAGQRVVTSGQFLIDSEASLKGATSRLGSGNETTSDAMRTHRASGRIEAIDNGEVMVSHGPVPTLGWDAMTMSFTLSDPALAKGIAVGQHVAFEFRRNTQDAYEIVSIRADDARADEKTPNHAHGASGAGAKP